MKRLIVLITVLALGVGVFLYAKKARAECSMTCYNGKCVTCCCAGSMCNCF